MNSIPVPPLKFLEVNSFKVEKYAQDFHPFNASIYNPPESFGEETDMSESYDIRSVKSMIWGVGMTLLYFVTRK